jgi:hypothetical protein
VTTSGEGVSSSKEGVGVLGDMSAEGGAAGLSHPGRGDRTRAPGTLAV